MLGFSASLMAGAVHSKEQIAVARAFADAREKANLRQEDLAAAIGKRQSYVSNIERGERRIDVLELFVIARALGLHPVDFYRHLTKDIAEDFRI